MKTGAVDVGGGLRGVYTAGVFDYCLDQDIRFDLGIGVSAGSANVASYIAKNLFFLFTSGDQTFKITLLQFVNPLESGLNSFLHPCFQPADDNTEADAF